MKIKLLLLLLMIFLFFPADSSKELEELRSAFARAVEYLKQEVEESKWNHPKYCSLLFKIIFIRPALHTIKNLEHFRKLQIKIWSPCGTCLLNTFIFLRAKCNKHSLFFFLGFSESGDPSCTIMQNWARVEVMFLCAVFKFLNLIKWI